MRKKKRERKKDLKAVKTPKNPISVHLDPLVILNQIQELATKHQISVSLETTDTKTTIRNVCDRQNTWQKAFNEDEALRAEQIMKSLEGLSIRSAKALMSKIDDYLLEELVTVVI